MKFFHVSQPLLDFASEDHLTRYLFHTSNKIGIENEQIVLEQYVLEQYVVDCHNYGHPQLGVISLGFLIDSAYSYPGASIDAAIYFLSDSQQPFGFLGMKNPCTNRAQIPAEA